MIAIGFSSYELFTKIVGFSTQVWCVVSLCMKNNFFIFKGFQDTFQGTLYFDAFLTFGVLLFFGHMLLFLENHIF